MLQAQEVGHEFRIFKIRSGRLLNSTGEQVQVRVKLFCDRGNYRTVKPSAQGYGIYIIHSVFYCVYEQGSKFLRSIF